MKTAVAGTLALAGQDGFEKYIATGLNVDPNDEESRKETYHASRQFRNRFGVPYPMLLISADNGKIMASTSSTTPYYHHNRPHHQASRESVHSTFLGFRDMEECFQ